MASSEDVIDLEAPAPVIDLTEPTPVSTPPTPPPAAPITAPAFALPNPIRQYHDFIATHSLPDTPATAALHQVHDDLLLARGWTDLRVQRTGTILYLLGCAAPAFDSVFPPPVAPGTDRSQAVLPIITDARLTPRTLSGICAGITHPQTHEPFRCVTAAIVECDGTTAYYRIFGDFDEIVDAQWKQLKDDDGVKDAEEDSGSDGDQGQDSASESSGSEEPDTAKLDAGEPDTIEEME